MRLFDAMHEQDLAIVKGLVTVAWADGHVSEEESQIIDALLDAFQATASQAVEVRQYAKSTRSLDDIPVTDLSYDDRRVLLHHAVFLTLVDGEQHEKEKQLIDELCLRLRISHAEAEGIAAAATARAEELRASKDDG